jgi:hypothetical protein
MSAAEKLIQLGQRLGEKRGEARGRRHIVAKQLRLKFGPLPARAAGQLARATERDLDRFAVRILEAETLDDVLGRPR